MIILGIDPGTATTGYGLIKKIGSKLELIDYGCILTPAKMSLPGRLEMLSNELGGIIREHQPAQMAVEELFFAANAKTAIAVGHARGVVLLEGKKNGLDLFEYTPLEVKMAITGYGRAEKRQMQEMVKALLSLEDTPKPDDASDALAVAICHANTCKNFKF